MARLETPRYFSAKRNKDGTWRYYWSPSPALRRAGWKTRTLSRTLGRTGSAGQPGSGALGEAEAINAEVAAWRAGKGPGPMDRRPAEAGAPAVETVQPDTLAHAIRLYQESPRWQKLAPKTRKDYGTCLRVIEEWAGDVDLRALDSAMVQEFYEALMRTGRHARANAIIRVLRLLLSDARRRFSLPANVAEKPGLIGTQPRVRVLSRAEIDALVYWSEVLDMPSIGDAVILAAYTGQRQGDLLRQTWQQVADGRLRLRQSKRGKLLSLPLAPAVVERLEAARARLAAWDVPTSDLTPVLVCELTGKRWVADTFKHRFAEVREAAARDVPSLLGGDAGAEGAPKVLRATYADLRDTAITRLAEASCTIPQIAAVSGHSLQAVHQVLRHYLATTEEQADEAIRRLVEHEAQQERKQAGTLEEASA